MVATLCGIQRVDFVDKTTGERIAGDKLHLLSEVNENDKGFRGHRVATIFVRDESTINVSVLPINGKVDLIYSQIFGGNKSYLSAINVVK